MQGAPRKILHLGHVAVSGNHFDFKPAPQYTFEAEGSDEVEVQVTFHFTEESLQKEGCHLKLALAIDAAPLTVVTRDVGDRPFVTDRYTGTLAALLPPMRPGYRKGSLKIEAVYSKGSWLDEKPDSRDYFTKEEFFTLHVK